MPLIDQPFAQTFAFSRGKTAAHRGPDGVEKTARRHVPRFDHDEDGAPLGLLIEGRPGTFFPDRIHVAEGDWMQPRGTVLHEWTDPTGVLRRDAWYAPFDPRSAVDAALNVKGHARRIAYVAGYLRNRGGFVRWKRLDWQLGGLVASESAVMIAADTAGDEPILEG